MSQLQSPAPASTVPSDPELLFVELDDRQLGLVVGGLGPVGGWRSADLSSGPVGGW
jgi:hypothetical protein